MCMKIPNLLTPTNKEMKKTSIKYFDYLETSEYVTLEVEQDTDDRITIKLFESRWRTIPETIAMLQCAIKKLEELK